MRSSQKVAVNYPIFTQLSITMIICVKILFQQGLFFPINLNWTWLSPMNQFRLDCCPESTKMTTGCNLRSASVFQHVEKQQLITFSVPGPRRTEAIAPDLARKYKVVFDSDRRFPTIFAKMWPIDKKKDQVLSGPKQSLVKWTLYASHVWFISNIKPCPMGLYYFY